MLWNSSMLYLDLLSVHRKCLWKLILLKCIGIWLFHAVNQAHLTTDWFPDVYLHSRTLFPYYHALQCSLCIQELKADYLWNGGTIYGQIFKGYTLTTYKRIYENLIDENNLLIHWMKWCIFMIKNSHLSQHEVDIVLMPRKTIIESDGKYWTWMDRSDNFDISMGSIDCTSN